MEQADFLKEGEHIDDLQRDGLRIIQRRGGFSFGVDSVLIANFSEVRPGERVLDIGSGTGIIPILLSAKTEAACITGVEIQPEMADMAQRSVRMNGLEDRIEILQQDIKDYALSHRSKFHVAVSNPPYFKAGGALISENDSKMISRHELKLNVFELFEAASRVLLPKGRFYLIHRPDRLVDICCAARASKLEIKRAKMVYSVQGEAPKLIILECIKGAGSEIKWRKPLVIYEADGNYSQDIYAIYQNARITSFEA
ncbi:MAG: tRNA1(Val) (adenine(37)-N6)-methyltransferase [Bacillota bacterium]|nr:tRNA1(Val) (adenine(37)-N6)-methyltransferase [Bacillota bacterium]